MTPSLSDLFNLHFQIASFTTFLRRHAQFALELSKRGEQREAQHQDQHLRQHGHRLVMITMVQIIAMERFFRDFRSGERRRRGQNSMSQFLQSMIADTPLVKNLENPDYLKVLLNGQPSLEACFAQIDAKAVRQEMEAAKKCLDRVPPKIHQLILAPDFIARLCNLFQKPDAVKSNRVL